MATVPSHEETGENPSPATEESAPAGAMEVVPSRDIFPAGYRFVPTDAELITEYLKKKINNEPIPIAEMSDVELYKHSPKKLSESYPRLGQNEWYFFTPRERKYKNGSRPNRAAGNGFWKATGADKHVYDVENNCVGYRKALVFYEGKAPSGEKTNWIMHEYRVDQQISRNKRNADVMRLDDWVLCRIYEKAAKPERNQKEVEAEAEAEAVAVVNVAAEVDEVNGPSPVTEEYDTPPVDQNPTENQFQNIPDQKLEQDHMSFDPHMGFEDHNMILHEFLEPPRVEYLPYDFGMTNLTESPLFNNTDFNDFLNLDIQNNQFTSPSYFVGHPTSTSTINAFHDGSSSSSFHAAVGHSTTSTSTISAFHGGSSSSAFHAAVGHLTTSSSTSAFHGGSSSSAFHAAVGHLTTSTSTSAFHDGSSSSAFHAAVGHPTSAFQNGTSSSSAFHAAPSTYAFSDPFIMAGAFADSLIKSEDCNSDVRPPTKKPKPRR